MQSQWFSLKSAMRQKHHQIWSRSYSNSNMIYVLPRSWNLRTLSARNRVKSLGGSGSWGTTVSDIGNNKQQSSNVTCAATKSSKIIANGARRLCFPWPAAAWQRQNKRSIDSWFFPRRKKAKETNEIAQERESQSRRDKNRRIRMKSLVWTL